MEESVISKIWNICVNGGSVMIPLFLLSVLLYGIAFHLVLYVFSAQFSKKHEFEWKNWISNPSEAEGRVGEIIRYTQDGVRSSKDIRNRFEEVRLNMTQLLDRQLIFLSTLVAAAPLLGLLGTVIGMLQTFLGIATSGGADTASVVAGGISVALITTMTGLTIALPGLFIVMIVRRKQHGIEANIARLESLTLGHLKLD